MTFRCPQRQCEPEIARLSTQTRLGRDKGADKVQIGVGGQRKGPI